MKPSPLVYLSTPYTKYYLGTERAFEEACEIAARLIRRGHSIFSPIAHSHPIAVHGGIDRLDHSLWLALDQAMIDRADELWAVAMTGWQESHGMAVEIAAFRAQEKSVRYVSWPDLEIGDLV